MTRKLFVKLIACLSITKGIWDIGTFLYPFFLFPSPIAIKVFPFVGGTLEIFAGISLFELSEAGRKFFLFLLYVSAAISAFLSFWTFFFWKDGSASSVYFFDEVIFQSENRFLSTGITVMFFVIPSLIIFFLSHRKTKELFTEEMIDTADPKTSPK